MNRSTPLLVSLQDIDNLLSDFSQGDEAAELRSLGFVVGKLKELKETREQVRAAIDPGLLRGYDRLSKVYKRRVVVPVVNGTCSGCFGVIATARLQKTRSGDRTLFCEHCGRILFWL